MTFFVTAWLLQKKYKLKINHSFSKEKIKNIMKIKIISRSDISGGAFLSAYRLQRELIAHDIAATMKVRIKKTNDCAIFGPSNYLESTINKLRPKVGAIINKLQFEKNLNLHSGNWLPSNWSSELNNCDADLINLHWVAGETLSIKDIGRLKKPLIWTLHDMWPFCGSEHYSLDSEYASWRTGHYKSNYFFTKKGIDLDQIVWRRKKRFWRNKIHIICPSAWLARCAGSSVLFQNNEISVIPNVLNTNIFQPQNQRICRAELNLPQNSLIILFGAIGGAKDYRKGYDLMKTALQHLRYQLQINDIQCIVFGQKAPRNVDELPFPTVWIDHINDDHKLAKLYSAANVMIVPSRQENLPQTATEAQSCGCPVVAFDCSGLPDAVVHLKTGYLAKPYDIYDLAQGIKWILNNKHIQDFLSDKARQRALSLWSPQVVIPQYINTYQNVIETHKL